MTDRFQVLLSGQWRDVTSAELATDDTEVLGGTHYTGELHWWLYEDPGPGREYGIAKPDQWRFA